jgi:hypothetical protein
MHLRARRPQRLSLRVGSYEIKVHLDGFTDFTRQLTLTVGSAFELPVALTVGGLDTAITVSAETTVLEAAGARSRAPSHRPRSRTCRSTAATFSSWRC